MIFKFPHCEHKEMINLTITVRGGKTPFFYVENTHTGAFHTECEAELLYSVYSGKPNAKEEVKVIDTISVLLVHNGAF